MNIHALEILEYKTIIKTIKNMAVSELGKKALSDLAPSNEIDRIRNQLKEVTEAKAILNTTSAVPLQNLVGIEGILDKLGKGIAFHPEDLTHIASMLNGIKRLISFMNDRVDIAPMVASYAMSMYPLDDVAQEINTCIYNSRVDDKASVQLEKIRKKIYVVEGRIKVKLDNIVRSSTYKKWLQDNTVSIKNNRYVIAVKSEYKNNIKGTVIAKSSTGSTLFMEPTIVGQMQSELELLRMDAEREEYQILMYLTSLIEENKLSIGLNIEVLTNYDVLFSKGKYSISIKGQATKVNHKGITKIVNGRHPLLGPECVPLNFNIGDDYKALVITGPNTGGKTVVLKTVGLFTAMIQTGLHIPVDSGSEIAIFSDILLDVGDGQSIEQSLSTFSSHITNIIKIMKNANPYTLVLLDEIGAGTDPMEGEGLAVAILEDLHMKGATLVSTSHYGEVKEFANKHKGFKNGKMTFNLETLRPNYVLEIGKAGESNAFIIALRLGMQKKVIENAHRITYEEDKDYSGMALTKRSTVPDGTYKKAKRPKSIIRQIEKAHKEKNTDVTYHIGDAVYVHSLKQRGLIFEEANHKQELGVKVKNKKLYIPKKRLTMFIEREQLYPDLENYDMDIIFESVEYRKKNRILSKRYDKDVEIIHKKGQ